MTYKSVAKRIRVQKVEFCPIVDIAHLDCALIVQLSGIAR